MQKELILSIIVQYHEDGFKSPSPLFKAEKFESSLIIQKLKLCAATIGIDRPIIVSDLSFNGVYISRCAEIKNISDLLVLIETIQNFFKGDTLRLYQVMGAFNLSKVTIDQLESNVFAIAPVVYCVKDNFLNGVDIRDHEKYNYHEVGRGFLIGKPHVP